MLIALLMSNPAFANTWGPIDDGFLIETRTDAPIDSQLVYGSNFTPVATVIEGPGAPFVLETALITGVGAPPRTSVRLASGNWQPDPGEATKPRSSPSRCAGRMALKT